MTCLVSKIDCFLALSIVQSICIHLLEGEEGYRDTVSGRPEDWAHRK